MNFVRHFIAVPFPLRGGALLCLLLLLVGTARAETPEVLRVGWFDQGKNYVLHYVDAAGVHQGVTPDTLRAAVAGSHKVINYRHYESYAAAAHALGSGEVDVVLDVLVTPERQHEFFTSVPYAEMPIGVVQPRAAAPIDSLGHLDGQRVAVVGDTWSDYLRKVAPKARPVMLHSLRDAVVAVEDGRADLYLGFHFSGDEEIRRAGLGSLRTSRLKGTGRTLYFMTRRSDAVTRSVLSEGLLAMPSEVRNDIQVRWLDSSRSRCVHVVEFSKEERDWLGAHPVLKIGIPGFTSPYDYLDDEQNWNGPGAELLRRFSLAAGIRLEPILLARNEAPHEALQRGVIDVAPSFTVGTGRGGILESASYTYEPWGWVERKGGAKPVARVAAVAWRLAGVRTSTLLNRYKIVPVANTAEALSAIVAGRADAAYVNLFAANDLINRNYQGRLYVATEQAGTEHLSFGLPASNELLRGMLNRAIATYRPGELEQLALGGRQTVLSVGYDKQRVWRTALVGALAVLGLFLLLAAINHRIRAARHAAELACREANAARRRAEAADRAKSVFLATMSHEIRTPMNGVIGVLDLLQDSALDEFQRRYLGVAEQSARLLLRVLNDVLDYSKIEAGALTYERVPFDVNAVADHITELFRPLAMEKNIGFHVATMPHFDRAVIGDAVRVTQLVANLVSNSIRFTEHGNVTVEWRNRLRRGAPHLQLTVRDTGCGMSSDFQNRLFDPFQQEAQTDGMFQGGTGLGLSIVKRLAELMGGVVRISSQRGTGTVAIVELPLEWGDRLPPWPDLSGSTAHVALAPSPMQRALCAWLRKMGARARDPESATLRVEDAAHAACRLSAGGSPPVEVFTYAEFVRTAARLVGAAAAPMEPGPALAAATPSGDVLLCEDHEINRGIILKQLEKLGFSARGAVDGEDGLAQWRRHQPRIVLADCQMPRLDGYALARAIRADEAALGLPRTLIIAVSANASSSDGDSCLAAGMDDYLEKPVTTRSLALCLRRWGVYPSANAEAHAT